MPFQISHGLCFLLCSVASFADTGPNVDLSAGELRKSAKEFSPTSDYSRTAQEYEDQTQRQNQVLKSLKGMTGTADTPPPTRAPASAASRACGAVNSFSSFKDCLGELVNRFNGTPDVAREVSKDSSPVLHENPLR